MGRVRPCVGGAVGTNEGLCYGPLRKAAFRTPRIGRPGDGELSEIPQEIGDEIGHNIGVETFQGTEGALVEGFFEGRPNGFEITINGR